MPTNWESLRAAPGYREFLEAYLKKRSLSLSDFARATGFVRGFPGDVLSGKRRLTDRSAHSFETALKLPIAGKKLFRFLVAQQELDLFPTLDRKKLPEKIAQLRNSSWKSPRHSVIESEAPNIKNAFRDPLAIVVYSAAGRPDRGATFAEIQARTGQSEAALKRIITQLEKSGLLQWNELEERYDPQDLHLFIQAKDQSELFLNMFQQASRSAADRAASAIGSDGELFFASTLCVSESKLPALKAALKETMLKFVDEAIEADGDRIVRLSAAMHR